VTCKAYSGGVMGFVAGWLARRNIISRRYIFKLHTATPANLPSFFSPQKLGGLNRTIKVHWIGIYKYVHTYRHVDLWVREKVAALLNVPEPSKQEQKTGWSLGNLWLCCVVSLFAAIFTILARVKSIFHLQPTRAVEHRNEVTWQLQLMLIARRGALII